MDKQMETSAQPHTTTLVETTKLTLARVVEERITDMLRSSIEAPKAKSTAAYRASVSFSRVHWHGEVIIHSPQQWELFEQLLSQSSVDIVSFLAEVQTISISAPSIDSDPERDWVGSVLTRCAPHLPCLERIAFNHVHWTAPGINRILSNCHGFDRGLTKLDLTHCKFGNLSQLHELVCGFSALSDLILSLISFEESKPYLAGSLTGGPQLSSLTFRWNLNVLVELSDWVTCMGVARSLSRLEWCPSRVTPEMDNTFQGLLATIEGRSLEHLAAKMWSLEILEDDLSRFIHLKSLSISVIDIEADGIPGMLKHTLTKLSSDRLEDLQLQFVALRPPSKPIDLHGFEECDEILSAPQFQNLDQITITIYLTVSEKDLPKIEDSPSAAAKAALAMLVEGPSAALTCDTSKRDSSDEYGLFLNLMKDTLQGKINDQFKQLCSRDILNLEIMSRTEPK